MHGQEVLLTSKEVLRITGYKSPVTIWRKVKGRTFPPPLQLSPQTIRWKKSDIDAWLASLPRSPSLHSDVEGRND